MADGTISQIPGGSYFNFPSAAAARDLRIPRMLLGKTLAPCHQRQMPPASKSHVTLEKAPTIGRPASWKWL